MGWPITKEALMKSIDELLHINTSNMIRPETKRRNKMLIDAYMRDLKKFMSNGGE